MIGLGVLLIKSNPRRTDLAFDIFVALCFFNVLYIPWGLRDLVRLSFRLNGVVTKVEEFGAYLLPPIQRPGTAILVLLLFSFLSWSAFYLWRNWWAFPYGWPNVLGIEAAPVAGLWWSCLLVGRAYGGGVLSGFRLSVWNAVMWGGGLGFMIFSAVILYGVWLGVVATLPLWLPGGAALSAATWWFGRSRFLYNIQS